MPRNLISDITTKLDISKIQPISDFVLVEIIERGATALGIILPHKEKTVCCYGKVLAVGSGTFNQTTGESYPMAVQPGDIGLSMDYAGERIHACGSKYRILREHGFWATVEMDILKPDKLVSDLSPLSDHLLVEFPKEEKTLTGRLHLPDNPGTMLRTARVVKVGPGMRHLKEGAIHPMVVKAGDRVICMRYSGAEVKVAGKDYRLMQQCDIKCIIEESAEVDILDHSSEDLKPIDADVVREENQATETLTELAERGLIDSHYVETPNASYSEYRPAPRSRPPRRF